MRIIVIGGSGTIGKAVVGALAGKHEVVLAGRTAGDYKVDISSPDSLKAFFDEVGEVDAIVSVAGSARFNALDKLTDEDFDFTLRNKLMGQVNVARLGAKVVNDGGSITLTSGVLASEPSPGSSAVSLVNAGLEGFVRAAALDLPRGIRINIVSPPWISETMAAAGVDPAGGLPATKAAEAYVASVEGTETGKVIDARTFG